MSGSITPRVGDCQRARARGDGVKVDALFSSVLTTVITSMLEVFKADGTHKRHRDQG
jgi:hypothetical protein